MFFFSVFFLLLPQISMNLRYYQPHPRVSGSTQQQDILELLTQDLTVHSSFVPTTGPSKVSIHIDRGRISLGRGRLPESHYLCRKSSALPGSNPFLLFPWLSAELSFSRFPVS